MIEPRTTLQDPTPELSDDTPLNTVKLPTRIRNALIGAGVKAVGEAREVSDATLLSLPDFGPASVRQLREILGLPSRDGVRLSALTANK